MNIKRIEWLDCLKGIAIILVVIGHVIRGFIASGMFSEIPLKYIDYTIYSFHMPLMFFLSGILYSKVEIKQFKEWKNFIINKIIKLYIPYLIFSYIMIIFKYLFANSINSYVKFNDIIMIPFKAFDIYWFLLALLTIFIVYSFMDYKKLNKKIIIIISLISLIISFYLQKYVINIYYIKTIIYYIGLGFYFYLGKLIATKLIVNKVLLKNMLIPLIFLYFGINCICYYFKIESIYINILLALSMISILILLFKNYNNVIINNKILKYIGKYSMVIYLTHTFFTAFVRIILNKIGIDDFLLQFSIASVIGIVLPIFIYYIINKFIILNWINFIFYPEIKFKKRSFYAKNK